MTENTLTGFAQQAAVHCLRKTWSAPYFLVQFQPEMDKSFENFLDLKEALEELFQRPVDLIEPQTIRSRRLRYYIDQSRAPIYDAA